MPILQRPPGQPKELRLTENWFMLRARLKARRMRTLNLKLLEHKTRVSFKVMKIWKTVITLPTQLKQLHDDIFTH